MNEFTQRLRTAVGVEGSIAQERRRVYVSRDRSRRRITNEQEMLPVLNKYGFEVVHTEDLTLREQISLFSETEVVMGGHGSGPNNHIFCRAPATVIELYNPVRYNTCTRGVATMLGFEHWFMYGKNIRPDYDTWIDPMKLDKLLSYVFRQGSNTEPRY